MTQSNKKAFICFCVDGPTDATALQNQFDSLFDRIGGDSVNITFRYALFQKENHGDITALSGVTPENVERSIYKYYFRQQDKPSSLGWRDLTTIIHIIDLDGAYCDNSVIQPFTDAEESLAMSLKTKNKDKNVLYFDDHIAVNTNGKSGYLAIEQMKNRNLRKRRIIEHLIDLDTLSVGNKAVRYKIYYFSSNLDHFLDGDPNLPGYKKDINATAFKEKYNDTDAFVDYFLNNPFCTNETDYYRSWVDVRRKSLSRSSNINLLITRILNSTLDDWL